MRKGEHFSASRLLGCARVYPVKGAATAKNGEMWEKLAVDRRGREKRWRATALQDAGAFTGAVEWRGGSGNAPVLGRFEEDGMIGRGQKLK